MSEKLAAGTRIKTMLNKEIVIDRWLAEGGQGDVYEVSYDGQKKALKWYKQNGIGKDKKAFYDNLKNNVIKGAPSDEFLWPLDITEWSEDTFGYVMDLRPEGYYELSDFMLAKVSFPSYRVTVDAALHIVSAYRLLHNKGYSYQDLNDGNFFINPQDGRVLICDNDNVAPNGVHTGIIGKPRYMAPEIVRREKMPDSLSDLYSMAVILFIMFFQNHPLEGKRSLVPCLTPMHQEKLYGTEPLFIMDNDNKDNAPDSSIHVNVLSVWPFMPDYMHELFLNAFSQKSLTNPNARPKELDWIKALVRFKNDIVPCVCNNEIFVHDGRPCKCEKCGRILAIYYRLKFQDYNIPAIAGNVIYRCQIGTCNVKEALEPVGAVIVNKADRTKQGIANISGKSWDVETPSGKIKNVMPNEVIPLKNGISFTVNGSSIANPVEIIEN